jgi:hypothetical protein
MHLPKTFSIHIDFDLRHIKLVYLMTQFLAFLLGVLVLSAGSEESA